MAYWFSTGVLRDGKWKPKNRGIEFLRIIDWELEREKKKQDRKDRDTQQVDQDSGQFNKEAVRQCTA